MIEGLAEILNRHRYYKVFGNYSNRIYKDIDTPNIKASCILSQLGVEFILNGESQIFNTEDNEIDLRNSEWENTRISVQCPRVAGCRIYVGNGHYLLYSPTSSKHEHIDDFPIARFDGTTATEIAGDWKELVFESSEELRAYVVRPYFPVHTFNIRVEYNDWSMSRQSYCDDGFVVLCKGKDFEVAEVKVGKTGKDDAFSVQVFTRGTGVGKFLRRIGLEVLSRGNLLYISIRNNGKVFLSDCPM